MKMSRRKFVFEQLQEFIKTDDIVSAAYVLRWEYQKVHLFELKNEEGLSLVHIACLEGNLRFLDLLLRNGASVHTKSSVGWTSLHAATLGGKRDVVSYLLHNCSADPLTKDDMGCIPSDLTMDKHILELLNRFADDAIVKRDIESLASVKNGDTRRRTKTFHSGSEMTTGEKPKARAQSMLLNKTEALEIRVQYAKSYKQEYRMLDRNLLGPHNALQRKGSNLFKSNSLNEDILRKSVTDEFFFHMPQGIGNELKDTDVSVDGRSESEKIAQNVFDIPSPHANRTHVQDKLKRKQVLKLKKTKNSKNRTLISVEKSVTEKNHVTDRALSNLNEISNMAKYINNDSDIVAAESQVCSSDILQLESEAAEYLHLDESDVFEFPDKNTNSYSSGISSSSSEYSVPDLKERHNDNVLRRKNSLLLTSDACQPTSPLLPRAVKFFTLDRTRRTKEAKNRDSGVFDEDIESDTSEKTGRAADRVLDDHYKLI